MEIIARFHIWSYNLYRYGSLDEIGWVVCPVDHRATNLTYNQILSKLWNTWLDQAAKVTNDVDVH